MNFDVKKNGFQLNFVITDSFEFSHSTVINSLSSMCTNEGGFLNGKRWKEMEREISFALFAFFIFFYETIINLLLYMFQGRLMGKADAYFNSFRRCNYPKIKAPNATPEIVYECARYSRYVFTFIQIQQVSRVDPTCLHFSLKLNFS